MLANLFVVAKVIILLLPSALVMGYMDRVKNTVPLPVAYTEVRLPSPGERSFYYPDKIRTPLSLKSIAVKFAMPNFYQVAGRASDAALGFVRVL